MNKQVEQQINVSLSVSVSLSLPLSLTLKTNKKIFLTGPVLCGVHCTIFLPFMCANGHNNNVYFSVLCIDKSNQNSAS